MSETLHTMDEWKQIDHETYRKSMYRAQNIAKCRAKDAMCLFAELEEKYGKQNFHAVLQSEKGGWIYLHMPNLPLIQYCARNSTILIKNEKPQYGLSTLVKIIKERMVAKDNFEQIHNDMGLTNGKSLYPLHFS